MARDFADEPLRRTPCWDEAKHFPVDVLREAAALGMAAIYVREDVGGSGLTPARRGADLRGAGRPAARRSRPSCRSTTWSPG